MESYRVKDLVGYLSELNRLFDVVRIIDPIKKKVVYGHGGDSIIHRADCYEFWEIGKVCDDCISFKAYREKTTFTKVEYKGDGVYMVMAAPIIFGGDEYVVEMLKDITEAGVMAGLARNT